MEKKRRIFERVMQVIIYLALVVLCIPFCILLFSRGTNDSITIWNFVGLAWFVGVAWLFKVLGIGEKEKA